MSLKLYEQLQSNAFPPLQTVLYDGWHIRFGGGFTYRVNCANPMNKNELSPAENADYIEELYKSKGMKSIFKLYEGMPGGYEAMESELDRRGYETERKGNLYLCKLDSFDTGDISEIVVNREVTDVWLSDFLDMNGTGEGSVREAAEKMLKNIAYPTLAASITEDDRTIACGLGVYERGYVGLYDIFVDSNHRRKHLGYKICAAIMAEGKKLGAQNAYLQVLSDNNGARAMYKKLGYEQNYEYWFRTK